MFEKPVFRLTRLCFFAELDGATTKRRTRRRGNEESFMTTIGELERLSHRGPGHGGHLSPVLVAPHEQIICNWTQVSTWASGPRPAHSRKRPPHAARKKKFEGNHRRSVYACYEIVLFDLLRNRLEKFVRLLRNQLNKPCYSQRRPLVVTSNSYEPLFGQGRF